MILRIFFFLMVSAALLPGLEPDPHLLDNGSIRLGVDKGSGASVFFLGESKTKRNLLNHADRGRFVQQSFYGATDGSKWSQKPWRWNPVQGGNWKGKPSFLESFKSDKTSLYSKTIPHHWAGEHLIRSVRMEQWIKLKGKIAEIKFRFTYHGDTAHPKAHQELPAVFMDYALPNLVFYNGDKPWTGDTLTRVVPGWPNELQKSTEHWAAYLDENNWGCGVYFPGTSSLTTYRNQGPPGPVGSGCSYLAPIRTLAITKGMRLNYQVYFTIGTVEEIRTRFAQIRKPLK